MDAITLLKDDHKTVEALFKQFERLHKQGGTAAQRRKVVSQIIKELSVHAVIEEECFYPRVRQYDADLADTVLESLEEHHIVKWTLHELEGMKATDERYDAKVIVLIESVRHHVEEEEHDLFPAVRKAVGRPALQEMGVELQELKKKAPRRPHPRLPDDSPLNAVADRTAAAADQLLDKATEEVTEQVRRIRSHLKARRPSTAGRTANADVQRARRPVKRA